jgi:hypothetical protein
MPSAASLLSLTAKESLHGMAPSFSNGYRSWTGPKIQCEEHDIVFLPGYVKIDGKILRNPETIRNHFCNLVMPRGGKRRNKTKKIKRSRKH